MTLCRHLAEIATAFLIARLVVACEAKVLDETGAPGADSGTSSTVEASACVDIAVAPSDLLCASDSDCTLFLSGHVCSGQCSCGNTPVNAMASARISSETASLTFEGCPCAFPGEARCLGGQCTLCGLGPNQPDGCSDAGVTAGDDSGAAVADSGMGIVEGGMLDTGISTTDGGRCVDIEVAPSDLSCVSDSDCTFVSSGLVCSGDCSSCGETPANAAAAARIQSDTASLTLVACPCASPGEPRCLAGQCARCGLGPDGPAGCSDAGTTVEDSGMVTDDAGGLDTGIPTADGGKCVDIDLSTYDQSCSTVGDCLLIQTGEVCSGQCACGGEPVNVSEQTRYAQATSGIAFGLCGCPLQAAPECVEKRCILSVVLPP